MKQAALRKHLDVLVQQTEDLHSSLEECEDEKADLANKLTQIIQEKDVLQEQHTQQQVNISNNFCKLFELFQKHLVWLNQPDYIRSHTNKNKPSSSAVPV